MSTQNINLNQPNHTTVRQGTSLILYSAFSFGMMLCLLFWIITCLGCDQDPIHIPTPAVFFIPETIGFQDFPPGLLYRTSGNNELNNWDMLSDDGYDLTLNFLEGINQGINRANAFQRALQPYTDDLKESTGTSITLDLDTYSYSILLEEPTEHSYRISITDPADTHYTATPMYVLEWTINQQKKASGIAYLRLEGSMFEVMAIEFGLQREDVQIMKIRACVNEDSEGLIHQIMYQIERYTNGNYKLYSFCLFEEQPVMQVFDPPPPLPDGFPARPMIHSYTFVLDNGLGAMKDKWLDYLLYDDFDCDGSLDFLATEIRSQFYFEADGTKRSWQRMITAIDDQYDPFESVSETNPCDPPETAFDLQEIYSTLLPEFFGVAINEAQESQTIVEQMREGEYQSFGPFFCSDYFSPVLP